MLSSDERRYILERATVPEHLPDYVSSITDAEPFLDGRWLSYIRSSHLIFIGFPLESGAGGGREEEADPGPAFQRALDRFSTKTAAITAPSIWLPPGSHDLLPPDRYFTLSLPAARPHPKTANMIRRAAREVRVHAGSFTDEHQSLTSHFAAGRDLDRSQRHIYGRLYRYLAGSETAIVLEARRRDALTAFTILEPGLGPRAFYLFHIRDLAGFVPGTSDLLFSEMIDRMQAMGKRSINLGLGVNQGNRRFKEKWGGKPFLPCESALWPAGASGAEDPGFRDSPQSPWKGLLRMLRGGF